ncbi:hypothetical protein H6P81_013785 [Aristolochia fimbriata]|uniref:Myb-like domain-containing protein n=1 Tax=Aristolochia fimbriata TaxID=158543 RepID=A0AAV7EJ97_ARIFI|nr:hypothetical protein H6P81_013785 [Aristolochia fimbriata]
MISSKVVLTYQRKRSSARVEAGHGTQSTNPHSESPVTLSSSNESSTKDPLVNHKGNGQDGSNGQFTDSSSSETMDSGLSGLLQVQDPRRRELKCLSDRSDVGTVTLGTPKLFLTPQCDQSASQELVKASECRQMESSTEKDSTFECEILTKSDKCSSETDYSAKSISSFCSDKNKKFRNPLITFCRRAKKKESVNKREFQICDSELSPKGVPLSEEAAAMNPLPVCRQEKVANEKEGGHKSKAVNEKDDGHKSSDKAACEFTMPVVSTHLLPSLDHSPTPIKPEPSGSVHEDYHPTRCDETSSLTGGMENSFSAARDSLSNLPNDGVCTGEAPRQRSMNEDETNLDLSVAPPNIMNLDVDSQPVGEATIKRKKVEHCPPMLPLHILNQKEFRKSLSGEVLNEVFPLASRSPEGTNSHFYFQGRNFPPQLDQNQSKQNLLNSSYTSPRFLDLSLPINPGSAVETLQNSLRMFSPPSVSSSSCRTQSASDEKSLSDRHRQLLDNILQRAGMFKANQICSLENLRAYTSMWSEEELDSLWIGVRRHGRNNWNVMLRDPKLHFSNWRTAEDLAEQWIREQSKLLNGSKHCQAMPLSKADFITCGRVASNHWPVPTLRNGITETQLSLGDVYSPKDEAILKRYPFHFAQPYSPPHMTKSSGLWKTELLQQKPTRWQRTRLYADSKRVRRDRGSFDLMERTADKLTICDHGVSARNLSEALSPSKDDLSSDMQEKGNLPHWLREVASVTCSPADLTRPPNVSALTPSVSLFSNENAVTPLSSNPGLFPVPSKGTVKMPRKKSRISSKTGCLRVTDRSACKTPDMNGTDFSWMETGLSLFSSVGSTPLNTARKVLDQNKAVGLDATVNPSNRLSPKDPIVVDSDASSEETISDDQS